MKIHFYFYTYLSEPEVLNDYCCGNPACYFERQAKTRLELKLKELGSK